MRSITLGSLGESPEGLKLRSGHLWPEAPADTLLAYLCARSMTGNTADCLDKAESTASSMACETVCLEVEWQWIHRSQDPIQHREANANLLRCKLRPRVFGTSTVVGSSPACSWHARPPF